MAIAELNMEQAQGLPVVAVYRCKYCGDWHLTKQEPYNVAEDRTHRQNDSGLALFAVVPAISSEGRVVTIYDLLRILVDDSSISGKEAAHELISGLEQTAAFGTVSSSLSTDGASHVHIPQQEWENSLLQRYIRRCATCRAVLSEPWWPDPTKRGR